MITFGHQFDAVLGVKLEGLGDRRLRVVNVVRHRAGRREVRIDDKSPITRVDSAVAVIDRIVKYLRPMSDAANVAYQRPKPGSRGLS